MWFSPVVHPACNKIIKFQIDWLSWNIIFIQFFIEEPIHTEVLCANCKKVILEKGSNSKRVPEPKPKPKLGPNLSPKTHPKGSNSENQFENVGGGLDWRLRLIIVENNGYERYK